MRLAVVCMNSAVLSRGWQIVRMTRAHSVAAGSYLCKEYCTH